ncbi:MAG: hypothetical protein KGI33_03605 [Thaumarchaeota archaeon]|nr:hypothetical protein [Nitrososphaerota archaeon]
MNILIVIVLVIAVSISIFVVLYFQMQNNKVVVINTRLPPGESSMDMPFLESHVKQGHNLGIYSIMGENSTLHIVVGNVGNTIFNNCTIIYNSTNKNVVLAHYDTVNPKFLSNFRVSDVTEHYKVSFGCEKPTETATLSN